MSNKIDMTLAEYIGAITRVALAMRLSAVSEMCQHQGDHPLEDRQFVELSAALAQTHSGQVVDGSSIPLLKNYLENARVAADIPPEAWESFCPVKFQQMPPA